MFGAGLSGLGIEQQLTVERAFQDGLQALVGTGLELNGPLTGGLQSRAGVDLFQPQNAQAGPLTHFRVRFSFQDGAHHFGGCGADLFGPVN